MLEFSSWKLDSPAGQSGVQSLFDLIFDKYLNLREQAIWMER